TAIQQSSSFSPTTAPSAILPSQLAPLASQEIKALQSLASGGLADEELLCSHGHDFLADGNIRPGKSNSFASLEADAQRQIDNFGSSTEATVEGREPQQLPVLESSMGCPGTVAVRLGATGRGLALWTRQSVRVDDNGGGGGGGGGSGGSGGIGSVPDPHSAPDAAEGSVEPSNNIAATDDESNSQTPEEDLEDLASFLQEELESYPPCQQGYRSRTDA
ncbi:unnamed protein product, partial [Pylaiella littoralis]